MATTNVNIRMDMELKKQFESFCSEVGMNTSTAFNMFAKKTVRDRRIPFVIGTETYNIDAVNTLLAELKRAEDESNEKGWIKAEDVEKELGLKD